MSAKDRADAAIANLTETLWKRYDKDKSKDLDMEEFKTVFKAQMEKKKIEYDEEKFKQAWAETDKDKSGKLDKAEFEAFVRTLVKK